MPHSIDKPKGRRFLSVEVYKTDDGSMTVEVGSDQHFIDCPVCRDQATIAAMRAVMSAQDVGGDDTHFVPDEELAKERVH